MTDYPDYPDYPDPTRATGGSSAADTETDEILAVIAAEEPRGATADQVARAIGLGLNGAVVQSLLEELVEQGLLDRNGMGDGAVYTRQAGT
ncbi:MAG: hypothetical protein M3Y74_07050 [Chloroflexota bacterium]|nr:hypothetical protein [Chloroflexota bacterium]